LEGGVGEKGEGSEKVKAHTRKGGKKKRATLANLSSLGTGPAVVRAPLKRSPHTKKIDYKSLTWV